MHLLLSYLPSSLPAHRCPTLVFKASRRYLSHPIKQLVLPSLEYNHLSWMIACISLSFMSNSYSSTHDVIPHAYSLLQYHPIILSTPKTCLCTGCSQSFSSGVSNLLPILSWWSALLPTPCSRSISTLSFVHSRPSWFQFSHSQIPSHCPSPSLLESLHQYQTISATWSLTSASPHRRSYTALHSKNRHYRYFGMLSTVASIILIPGPPKDHVVSHHQCSHHNYYHVPSAAWLIFDPLMSILDFHVPSPS